MTNDYFNYASGRLADGVKARAPVVNAVYDLVVAGFDKLPTEVQAKLLTVNYGTDSGAANAYVVTLPHVPAAYVDGMRVVFKASATNTGASTINVNSLGLKSLKRHSGTALSSSDILAGKMVECIYNATTAAFELIGHYGDSLLSSVLPLIAGSGALVSSNDTTVGYLNGKLVAGTGITLTEGSDGGNETLTIAEDNVLVSGDLGVTVQAYDADTAKIDAANTWSAKQTFGDIAETVYALSTTTPAISPANGTIQTWTLTGDSTPTAGTWAAGQSITLMVDDGTAYTITWTSLAVTWKTDVGTAPTLNTSGYTAIVLWKVGTTIYGARVGDA